MKLSPAPRRKLLSPGLRALAALPALALAATALAAPPQNSTAASSSPDGTLAKSPDRLATPGTINVNGVVRSFRVYVPSTFRRGQSALLVALHGRGGGGPGSLMEQYSELDSTAEKHGFAVVYPDGLVDATGTVNWNYFYNPFFVDPPDDVAFIGALIHQLQTQLHTDRKRTYVTGTSAGGFMAQRVGIELSDRIAAVGVVEGGTSVITPTSPQTIPSLHSPVSIVFLKGDADPNNYYCGAVFSSFGIAVSSADQDFDYWSGPAANQCAISFPSGSLCKSVGVGNADFTVTPGAPSDLVAKEGFACRALTEVRLYRLLGGEDVWNQGELNRPGQLPYNPLLNSFTGVKTNDVLWRFFEQHPKRRHW